MKKTAYPRCSSCRTVLNKSAGDPSIAELIDAALSARGDDEPEAPLSAPFSAPERPRFTVIQRRRST